MTTLLAAQFIAVLLATIASLAAPRAVRRALKRLRRIGAAVGRRHWLSIILVGLASFSINATISIAVHWPQPAVHDEFAYLLTADTIAAGRLMNPPPPSPKHFETYHVIVQPTYQSKYPPGQGLALALGQAVFGHALIGVWLSLAASCMAVCWMLQGWTKSGWALLGSLVIATNPAMIVSWGQTYWGGSVAMLGGALLFGSVRRIAAGHRLRKADVNAMPSGVREQQLGISRLSPNPESLIPARSGSSSALLATLDQQEDAPSRRRIAECSTARLWTLSALLGTGIVILANSRPLEGLIASVPAAFALMAALVRHERATRLRWTMHAAAPAALALALGALWFVTYNRAVTGEALTMPYQAWNAQYSAGPGSLPPAAALGSHLTGRARTPKLFVPDDAMEANLDLIERRRAWARNVPAKVFMLLLFYLSALMIVLPAVVLEAARRPWTVFALTVALLLSLVVALEPTVGHPHYAAPVACLFGFVMVAGLRRLMAMRRMMVIPLSAAALMLAAIAVGPIAAAVDQASRRGVGMAADRAMVLTQLKAMPGQDLVFVRYGPTSLFLNEWVYNRADLDRAEVVWARDLGTARNARLLEHFSDRRLWLLQAESKPPRLQPYESGATTENDRAARESAETAPSSNADIR